MFSFLFPFHRKKVLVKENVPITIMRIQKNCKIISVNWTRIRSSLKCCRLGCRRAFVRCEFISPRIKKLHVQHHSEVETKKNQHNTIFRLHLILIACCRLLFYFKSIFHQTKKMMKFDYHQYSTRHDSITVE